MNILELAILKKMVGGGGGSGTDNYNDLSNLPQINGETLAGNKTAENLGLQDALTFDSTPTKDSTNPVESGGVFNALAGKQDNLTFDGTYDASTNKAATESTVTDAINELDVSETSFDADETIDTISETDGKIAVTKKDIAIASNQVTSMTGYTKPSSAPDTPAIQTNDTANQAFGKLEFKADTNQTNILLVEKSNPMCNELYYNVEDLKKINSSDYSWSDNVASLSGVKFTINEDNSISWVATNIANTVWLILYDSSEMPAIASGEYVLHGCPSGGGISTYELEAVVGGTDKKEYGDSTSFTVSNNLTLVAIGIRAGSSSGTFYPVLINKSLYDAGITDYVIPAKQNYDLTRLESEDRASLAEVVDSGAKNLFNPTAKSVTNPTGFTGTITRNSDNSYTINGSTGNSVYYYYLGDITLKAGTYTLYGRPDANSALYVYDDGSWIDSEINRTKTFEATTKKIYIRIAENKTLDNYTVYPMITTKSQFDISSAYQPFALPNYNLTYLEAEDRAALAEEIDAGAKNLLDTPTVTVSDITFTADSDHYITASPNNGDGRLYTYANCQYKLHLKKGTYVLALEIKTSTSSNKANVLVINTSNTEVATIPNWEVQNKTGLVYREFTISTEADYGVLMKCYTMAARLMICTKAAFGVSKAFVPYRPNYDLVSYLANAGGFHDASHGSFVQNADLNAISESCVRLYHSPSNNPTTATYVLVKTYMLDSTTGMQEATAFASPVKSYTRVKMASTWGSWVETTNA